VPAIPPGDVHPANDNPRLLPADSATCPAAPPPLGPCRRDAWSRWARRVRRLRA
jgi:hypothetical protein